MNPIALYFASGESLYPGIALLLIGVILGHFVKKRWLCRLCVLAVVIGLLVIVVSSAPFPSIAYLLFWVALVFWLFTNCRPKLRPALKGSSAIILSVCTIALAVLELPYRCLPKLPAQSHARLTVIGDSISAGIGGPHAPWPKLYEQTRHVSVKNLSLPGICIADALPLIKQLTPEDTLILIELGGNDMLFDHGAAEFESDLERLLVQLRGARPNATLVMFEIPLLPHKTHFGEVQRRLTKVHNVYLIPKRCFIHAVSGADATSDGLHLSHTGAQRMCDLVQSILPATLPTTSRTP